MQKNKELRQFAGILMMLGSGLAKKPETKVEIFATGAMLTFATDKDIKEIKNYIDRKDKAEKQKNNPDIIDIEYQEVKE